ncbi:MAG: leucine-rich repeat domain-containing protein [Thermoplasmata archaeon]|nr:leucine-rich repeat domain-containing protein [Thermoplasmata archaeon]
MSYEEALDRIKEALRTGQIYLGLSGLGLKSLPPEIGKLTKLTRLDLDNNQLRELPPEITKLTKLTRLDLDHNQLRKLPPEIGKLTNLTTLSLYENQLTALPPEIGKLTKLTELSLFNNQLTALPPEIGKLTKLTELSLFNNQLTALPPELGKLTKLTTLRLYNNQLTALPPEIGKLTNLTKLYLAYNQLITLPPELGKLTKLTELHLHSNQLTTLPPEIGKLTKLILLDLHNNQLTALPPEIGNLTNLTRLYLGFNQLTALPPEIWKLTNLTRLDLDGNPLEHPPLEIAEKGIEAIRNYFKSLEEEKVPLNEVKVLLVGDGGAGKTCLVNRLLKDTFDLHEPQTDGINISDWTVKKGKVDIKVHLWDFGGQEIMHATHQFFLSRRSLYILVLDGRKDEKTEYWLKHIESFGGASPILVVLNKLDENPGFDVNRNFLREKYKGIKGFYPVSCATGKGIKPFGRALQKALTEVELIRTTWGKSWFNIKTRLENMTKNFISYEEYKAMCEKEGIREQSAQDTLVDFLNDLGVVLHFRDLELLDTHVIEPKWVTEAVYKIINSDQLAESKGVLHLKLLGEILKRKKDTDYEYPRNKHGYIIELMTKFELCYDIDKKTVLVPDLLKVQEPDFEFDYEAALKFRIDYDFLPRSVMPRFIVKMHRDIKNVLQWRTGVVLKDKEFNSTAVIKADNEARKIFIYVNGEQKRDYFAVILFNLRGINQSFEKLEVIERVPLPDNPKVAVSYEHLLTLEQMGKEKFVPEGSKKEYKVSELLGTIYVKRETEDERLRILDKFVEQAETEEAILKTLNELKKKEVLIARPTVFGFGVDFKALAKKLFDRKKRKGKSKRKKEKLRRIKKGDNHE